MSNSEVFRLPHGTSLSGHIGMILCWWWDDEDERDTDIAASGVRMIPELLSGETDDWTTDDWWIFADALGSYPHRTPELERLFEQARVAVAEDYRHE